MPVIKPFRAVRYNKKSVKDLARVVAPPYDIIPPALHDELYKKSEHNFVRIELNKIEPSDDASNNRYTRSRGLFESWLRNGILIRDEKPAIYIYSQVYKDGGKNAERLGFLAMMALDMGSGSKVLPHENTLAAPKADRLNLIREVQANLSPIFVLYDDKTHKVVKIMKRFCAKNRPVADVVFEGVRNRIWALDDASNIKQIADFLKDKDIFIADGHHRYETSKNYAMEIAESGASQELRDNSGYIMVYFVESDPKMLTVLPAHRLVEDVGGLKDKDILSKVEEYFTVKKMASLNAMMAALGKAKKTCTFGMCLPKGDLYLLTLKSRRPADEAMPGKPKEWRDLDVSVLHMFVIRRVLGARDDDDNVEFVKEPKEVKRLMDGGKYKVAFFLNPTKVEQVKRIAKIGEKMPRKATYFYPKPISGLVVNKLS